MAMPRKAASASSPSERIRIPKKPMIALKSVKTLPATMLAVEREEPSLGEPSLRRRLAASALESPFRAASSERTCVKAASATERHSIGFGADGAEARTQPRLLGHRARRGGS